MDETVDFLGKHKFVGQVGLFRCTVVKVRQRGTKRTGYMGAYSAGGSGGNTTQIWPKFDQAKDDILSKATKAQKELDDRLGI